MTISANDRRKPYKGNGVAVTFNGPRAFSASHVQVFVGTHPTYVLMPNSAYTINGVGGTATRVTFNAPPANNADILLLRTVPYVQDTDITNQGAFNPEIHENAFDMRVMQIQQLADGSIQLVFEDGEFVWDAKGSRIVNVGDALGLMDAMNRRSVLTLVEEIQEGGGVVGVRPKFWDWEGDGVTTGIPVPEADVEDPTFYDTAIETSAGSGKYYVARPGIDFTLEIDDTDFGSSIMRFAVPPPSGSQGFSTLRGYARPYTGPQPITTTAPRIIDVVDDLTVDGSYHNSVLRVDAPADVVITIRENTGSDADWGAGRYFFVLQQGVGKVSVALEDAGTLTPPFGFSTETRAVGSKTSFLCESAVANEWTAGGDLLRVITAADPQSLFVPIGDETTNITTGTAKYTFRVPYGFKLSTIAGSLSTAQSAGSILTVDVKRNGISILSALLTFDNTEKTTRTAATPMVFANGGDTLGQDDEITIDVTQVGTAGARGLKLQFVGVPIP